MSGQDKLLNKILSINKLHHTADSNCNIVAGIVKSVYNYENKRSN